jgi:hypothetical protein
MKCALKAILFAILALLPCHAMAQTGSPVGTAFYSQGTWTPTLLGTSVAGAPTYSTQTGYYERIGRLVIARFNIVTTSMDTASGNLNIGGLPFAVANLSNGRATVIFGVYSGITFVGSTQLAGDCLPNASACRVLTSGTGVSSALVDIATQVAAATTVEGTIIFAAN